MAFWRSDFWVYGLKLRSCVALESWFTRPCYERTTLTAQNQKHKSASEANKENKPLYISESLPTVE
jgi:hypothetical protein